MNSQKTFLKATFIVNPVSGIGTAEERSKTLKSAATSLGWVGTYIKTTKERSAYSLAKAEVKRGVKHIVVCGGDGTIREVLEAVVNTKIVIGIVPLGTGNLFAKNLSLPLDIEEAVKVALLGNQKIIDIGKVNGNFFSIIAGIGLDAEVMHGAKRELKDRWGQLAYVMIGLKRLFLRSGKYEIRLDKKKPFVVKAKTIMASNMGKLVGGIEVVPSTDPQSGTLQIGVIKAQSFFSWVSVAVHALLGKVDKSPHYDTYQAQQIEIRSLSGAKRYQCDGDHFPKTDHLEITLFPQAVTIMVNPDEVSSEKEVSKKVLVFDFDGTLANSLDLFIPAVLAASISRTSSPT